MPPILAALPLIAAIGGLAGTGVGLGLELSNRPGSPSPTAATNAGVTAEQNNSAQQAEKAAISQQAPNVNAATSGLANPEYVEQIAQLLAGTAGQPGSTGAAKSAIAQAFGLPGGAVGPAPGVQGTSTSNFTPAGTTGNANAGSAPVNLSEFDTRFFG